MDLRGKIYINDSYYITYGRLLITLLITLFQFLGMLASNDWIVEGYMFFLIANAFIGLMPQKLQTTLTITEKAVKEATNVP